MLPQLVNSVGRQLPEKGWAGDFTGVPANNPIPDGQIISQINRPGIEPIAGGWPETGYHGIESAPLGNATSRPPGRLNANGNWRRSLGDRQVAGEDNDPLRLSDRGSRPQQGRLGCKVLTHNHCTGNSLQRSLCSPAAHRLRKQRGRRTTAHSVGWCQSLLETG